jgi:hypothetical protein
MSTATVIEHFRDIGKDHRILIRETRDGYVLRFERPGEGPDESIFLTDRETHELMDALIDAIGTK